jgi:hypothetical protein
MRYNQTLCQKIGCGVGKFPNPAGGRHGNCRDERTARLALARPLCGGLGACIHSIGGPQTALRAAFRVPLHHRRGGIDCFACLEGVPQRSFSPCSLHLNTGSRTGKRGARPNATFLKNVFAPSDAPSPQAVGMAPAVQQVGRISNALGRPAAGFIAAARAAQFREAAERKPRLTQSGNLAAWWGEGRSVAGRSHSSNELILTLPRRTTTP